MAEMILRCSCCCYQMTLPEDTSALDCPACGMRNVRPAPEKEESFEPLQRAIEQRSGGDFAQAEDSYQAILMEPNQHHNHEALWGRLLCHYGVEYVEDPATHRRMPTVHTVQPRPMQGQQDFLLACKYAPAEVCAQYQQTAAYIDKAQAEIRRLAEDCPDYDVFLCHKTTKPGTQDKTADYAEALKLYHYLKGLGMRVFFAPECLAEDVSGAPYEAGIYHALYTAKVMLVLCSEPEYVQSAWVRSEWKRFLAMVDAGQQKYLIPLLYSGFDAGKLPMEFQHRGLQGMQMGQLNSTQMLTARLQKVLGMAPQPLPGPTPAPGPAPVDNAAQMLKRARMYMQVGQWQKAEECAEQAVQLDPESGEAYVCKLLIAFQCAKIEDLKALPDTGYEESENYKLAMLCVDARTKDQLTAAGETVRARMYATALQTMAQQKYREAQAQFAALGNYQDAMAQIAECARLEGIRTAREQQAAQYDEAMAAMARQEYEQAASLFTALGNYKNAVAQAQECAQQLAIKAEEERARLYEQARESMEQKNYDKAIQELEKLGDYRDAKALLIEASEQMKQKEEDEAEAARALKYNKAVSHMSRSQYKMAISLFEQLPGYKDVDAKLLTCRYMLEKQKKQVQAIRIICAIVLGFCFLMVGIVMATM